MKRLRRTGHFFPAATVAVILLAVWLGHHPFTAAGTQTPASPANTMPGGGEWNGQPAYAREDLVGHWRFYMKIYDGREMPEPPNATLDLNFIFHGDGTNRLYWEHTGEDDLCDRKGVYDVQGDILIDRVTWVNPDNARGCERDPDMQLGREAQSRFDIVDGDFHLHMHLGDLPLTYVWEKIDPEAI